MAMSSSKDYLKCGEAVQIYSSALQLTVSFISLHGKGFEVHWQPACESWWCPHRPCASLGQEGRRQLGLVQLIFTWQGRYNDQEGCLPRARLGHCTPVVLTPANFFKCRNLDCTISGSGELRSRSRLT